jgi:hypothetical protein
MHIDENKKFDKRNIEKNIKSRIITQKDYENYLSKLPDVSDKLFIVGENSTDLNTLTSKEENQITSKKKGQKIKKKGKGT